MCVHENYDRMTDQATLTIGVLGNSGHGKTAVVKAITGIDTMRFQIEKIRLLSSKLGYCNAKIYQCPSCPAPQAYQSCPSSVQINPKCRNKGC